MTEAGIDDLESSVACATGPLLEAADGPVGAAVGAADRAFDLGVDLPALGRAYALHRAVVPSHALTALPAVHVRAGVFAWSARMIGIHVNVQEQS